MCGRVAAGTQLAQRPGHLDRGAHEHVAQRDGLLHRGLDRVEPQHVGGLLEVVDDVVDRRGQAQPLPRVEGQVGARAPAQAVDQLAGDAVALVLAVLDVPGELGPLGEAGQQLTGQPGAALDLAAERVEELRDGGLCGGDEAGHHLPGDRTFARGPRKVPSPLFHRPFTTG